MLQEFVVLILTAASLGFIHTVLGPDHYIPFIAMSRAGKWSLVKTSVVTILCGIGHILSSVLLGLVGIALGIAVSKVEGVESIRGEIVAWALIAFGLAYGAWGLHRAWQGKPHTHRHLHDDQGDHTHRHDHVSEEHMHVHAGRSAKDMTPWILFTIFIFGPCEPMIPLVMCPAAIGNLWEGVALIAIFGVVTIATMLAIVVAAVTGMNFLPSAHWEKYSHAFAGVAICLCGAAIKFLGM